MDMHLHLWDCMQWWSAMLMIIPEGSADDHAGGFVTHPRQLLQPLKGVGHHAIMLLHKHLQKEKNHVSFGPALKAMLCYDALSHALLSYCWATLCCAMLCCVVLRSCWTMLCCVVLSFCWTMLCCAMLCHEP